MLWICSPLIFGQRQKRANTRQKLYSTASTDSSLGFYARAVGKSVGGKGVRFWRRYVDLFLSSVATSERVSSNSNENITISPFAWRPDWTATTDTRDIARAHAAKELLALSSPLNRCTMDLRLRNLLLYRSQHTERLAYWTRWMAAGEQDGASIVDTDRDGVQIVTSREG